MPNSSEREGRVYTPPIYHPQFNTETQKRVQKKGVHYHQLRKGERTQKEPCPQEDNEMYVILEPSITSNPQLRHSPDLEQGMTPGQLSQPFKTMTLKLNFAEMASHPCQAGFNS